jgi:hypothetical protein
LTTDAWSSMGLRWLGSGPVKVENWFLRRKARSAVSQLVAALESISLKDTRNVA